MAPSVPATLRSVPPFDRLSRLDQRQWLRIRIAVATGLVIALPFAFAYTFVYLINEIGLPLLEWANERPYTGEVYVDPVVLAVDELFAVDGYLIVVDGDELYGLHAAPGERWSPLE